MNGSPAQPYHWTFLKQAADLASLNSVPRPVPGRGFPGPGDQKRKPSMMPMRISG